MYNYGWRPLKVFGWHEWGSFQTFLEWIWSTPLQHIIPFWSHILLSPVQFILSIIQFFGNKICVLLLCVIRSNELAIAPPALASIYREKNKTTTHTVMSSFDSSVMTSVPCVAVALSIMQVCCSASKHTLTYTNMSVSDRNHHVIDRVNMMRSVLRNKAGRHQGIQMGSHSPRREDVKTS